LNPDRGEEKSAIVVVEEMAAEKAADPLVPPPGKVESLAARNRNDLAASEEGHLMATRLKLHLGCGPTVVPGWENVDKSPSVYLARFPRLRRVLHRAGVIDDAQGKGFPSGIVHADVSRRLPYADGSASYVYSSHLIEHLSRWQALRFVRECRRVLRPGGIMRVATPDLNAIVEAYRAVDRTSDGEQTRADTMMAQLGMFRELQANHVQRLIHRVASGSYHQWLYDSESLIRLLTEGGFNETRICSYRKGETPDLDQLEHRPESLIVEARR
jgi:predicted SAM-dependent methyltransferase